MYTELKQGTNALLQDVRKVTHCARKRTRQVQELEAKLSLGQTQKVLLELAIDLY